ncbi:MAG TPA: hypothetical protein VGM39_10855 [Kofleriaceae bacterium]|jgi:hypothetical protein
MKYALVLVLVAACGGSPPPAPSPLPPVAAAPPEQFVDPAPQTIDKAPEAPDKAPEPAPPASPPAPPPLPVADRLRDEGPVAGMDGWTLKRTADATYCTGMKITTVRGKKKIAAEDKPLVDVYALAFPANLNFDPANQKRAEAEKTRFDDWIKKTLDVTKSATTSYQAKLAPGGDVAEAVRATARIAQINYRFASLLLRAPIPKDVRTGEYKQDKTTAYCDLFAEQAEPLVASAEQAIAVCAQKIDPTSTDWPAAFCKL